MLNPDVLRLHLAQARLHVRRAQNCVDHEPRLRATASDECDLACALIDHVMRALAEPEAEKSEAAE